MNNKKHELTPERLSGLFNYDPVSGVLSHVESGEPVSLKVEKGGELTISLWRKYTVRAKRLIWCLMNGEFPSRPLSYRNGLAIDLRWSNIEAV